MELTRPWCVESAALICSGCGPSSAGSQPPQILTDLSTQQGLVQAGIQSPRDPVAQGSSRPGIQSPRDPVAQGSNVRGAGSKDPVACERDHPAALAILLLGSALAILLLGSALAILLLGSPRCTWDPSRKTTLTDTLRPRLGTDPFRSGTTQVGIRSDQDPLRSGSQPVGLGSTQIEICSDRFGDLGRGSGICSDCGHVGHLLELSFKPTLSAFEGCRHRLLDIDPEPLRAASAA